MFYSLLSSFTENYSYLNVFKYITFRTGLSVITSFIIVFLIGEPLIRIFKKNQISGPIRQDGPIDHIIKKSGTPTMGGLIIIFGITFFSENVRNRMVNKPINDFQSNFVKGENKIIAAPATTIITPSNVLRSSNRFITHCFSIIVYSPFHYLLKNYLDRCR